MIKKFIFQFSAVCLTAMLFILTGCQDKDLYDSTLDPEKNNNPSVLDFSTTQDVKLNVAYNVPTGYVAAFNVYASNPYVQLGNGKHVLKDGIEPIAAGISVSGNYDLTKTIPGYVTELYVHSSNLFVPELMYAKIEGGVANFSVVSLDSAEMGTRTMASNGSTDFYLGTFGGKSPYAYKVNGQTSPGDVDGNHRPNYIDDEKTMDFTTPEAGAILQRINAAFPDKKTPVGATVGDASIYLEEDANLWVSVIHSDGKFNSALSYFWYNGTKENLAKAERSELLEVVAFPLAKLYSGEIEDADLELKAGEYVQLKYRNPDNNEWTETFPAGTTVGWVLRSDGYNKTNKTVGNGAFRMYSVPEWNGGVDATVLFNAGSEDAPFICFGFEDILGKYNGWNTDYDMNDVIFHVKSDPVDAIIDIPTIPEVEPTEIDDKNKGILLYEDNWPKKGDYDLNDVVVQYQSTSYLYAESGKEKDVVLTKRTDVFTLLHTGANYDNAFAYKVDWDPSVLKSITINDESYTPISDGSGFIVKLTNNVGDEIPRYGKGQVEDLKVYTVTMTFRDGVITQEASNSLPAPYNPYISPAQTPGAEVHLVGYKPTEFADVSLFNTKDDCSDQNTLWYVGPADNKYPFALNLAGVTDFTIPEESKSIGFTYPKYDNWVNNGCGTIDADWYLYPTPTP